MTSPLNCEPSWSAIRARRLASMVMACPLSGCWWRADTSPPRARRVRAHGANKEASTTTPGVRGARRAVGSRGGSAGVVQLADRGERGVDRAEVRGLHAGGVVALLGAAGRSAHQLEREREPQPQPVVILVDVVVDRAEHRPGQPGEPDPLERE